MNEAAPTQRFGKTAEDYERHRPGYPVELVAWIGQACGTPRGGKVVDLGAGTGIASRLFSGAGYDVTGVEPNEAMRERAEAAGGARYVGGQAESTGLPAASADLVVAAQAFHWFDLGEALGEIARILRPAGGAAAFWNIRATTALLRDYDAIVKRFVAKYDERPQGQATIEAIAKAEGVAVLARTELAYVQRLDKEGLLGRARSSSYVAHDARDQAGLERALGELWEKHARGGAVDFAYRTIAIAWRPKRSAS